MRAAVVDEVLRRGRRRRPRSVSHAQLGADVGDVAVDGVRAEEQPLGDPGVALALPDEPEDVELTGAQLLGRAGRPRGSPAPSTVSASLAALSSASARSRRPSAPGAPRSVRGTAGSKGAEPAANRSPRPQLHAAPRRGRPRPHASARTDEPARACTVWRDAPPQSPCGPTAAPERRGRRPPRRRPAQGVPAPAAGRECSRPAIRAQDAVRCVGGRSRHRRLRGPARRARRGLRCGNGRAVSNSARALGHVALARAQPARA